jgi:hypothetical protein
LSAQQIIPPDPRLDASHHCHLNRILSASRAGQVNSGVGLPVVVTLNLSAPFFSASRPKVQQDAVECGAQGFVLKPDIDTLHGEIDRALQAA